MYVSVYVYVCAHVYVCAFACMRVCVCVHTRARAHIQRKEELGTNLCNKYLIITVFTVIIGK